MYDRTQVLETLKELTQSIEKFDSLDVLTLQKDLKEVAKKQANSSPRTKAFEFGELEKLAKDIAGRFTGADKWFD